MSKSPQQREATECSNKFGRKYDAGDLLHIQAQQDRWELINLSVYAEKHMLRVAGAESAKPRLSQPWRRLGSAHNDPRDSAYPPSAMSGSRPGVLRREVSAVPRP